MDYWRAPYSSSVRYSITSFVKSRVSMKLNMAALYGIAVYRQGVSNRSDARL